MPIRDNKFARQADQLSKRNSAGENKSSIDIQLVKLEEDIRKLKIEYDVFFNNGSKRAPFEMKNRVETTIKRLADERSLTFAQRYQYNSLVARYTSMRELWRRTMQGREEGRDAATIAREAHHVEADMKQEAQKPKSFSCADVERDIVVVRNIYDALIRAKQSCNEPVTDLTFERFKSQLAVQTERFKKNSGCQKVVFEIGAENGAVFFKARKSVDE
jgi:hypothetical protein